MVKQRKMQSAVAGMLLTSLALTACGGGAQVTDANIQQGGQGAKTEGKATVTFWSGAITPEREAFWQQVTKDFMEKHPDIVINYLGVPGDLTAYNQKVNVAIAAGEAPDIINTFSSDLIARDLLQPLDDYLAQWDSKDKLTPGSIAGMRSVDPKGGKLYGLPYGIQPWIMWVRPDWYQEAGLQMPETWEQFFANAEKLTDKSNSRYGYGIRGGAGSANTLEMLMYSYSGITNYFTPEGKATINDPLHVEFLDKYLGGYNVHTPEDDLNKGWTELAASFQSGKVGMIAHNLGSASAHEKAFNGDATKFTAIPFPKSVNGTQVHPGPTPNAMLMLKTAKDKDAAWKFMTFFALNYPGAYGKLYGEIPPNLEAMKEEWIQSIPYMKTGAELMGSADTQYTDNPYYLPGYTNIQKTMEPMIQKVMAKRMSSKELLDEWAIALEKEKADFDAASGTK